MKLSNEFQLIRDWAKQKGIYEKGDIKTQYIKLQEEAGELAKAIINNDKKELDKKHYIKDKKYSILKLYD